MTHLKHHAPVQIHRRRALQLGAAGIALSGLAAQAPRSAFAQATPTASPAASPAAATPISGKAVPELAAFDTIFTNALPKWNLPGAQVAIAREGRLVYSRGFGYASLEDDEPVETSHLFRIASDTKPITGVAILKLVDDGLLTLDTPVFPLLAFDPPANAPHDPRLDVITVKDLLVHGGGWDSAGTGFDPQYLPWPALASLVLGTENPTNPADIIRYMLSQPLDFDPGTKSSYSNFGFNVLGRVIEHVTGTPYEQWTLDNILTPSGSGNMRIGGTTLAERLPGEVRYYGPTDEKTVASVYPGEGFVPVAYGSYYMRGLDSHGGWIASAEDLVRFTLAIDGTLGDALLTPASIEAMETTERPPAVSAGTGNAPAGTGLAWNTPAVEGGHEWVHAGALEGSTASWIFRSPDGTTIAWNTNSLPVDIGGFLGDLIGGSQAAAKAVTTWPDSDLFS